MIRVTNLTLEAAIAAEPDRAELFAAYGRWLQQQGDPFGRFIELRSGAGDAVAQAEAERLFEQHRNEWFGGGTPEALFEIDWFCGCIRSIRTRSSSLWNAEVPTELARLLSSRAARFVRSVFIRSHRSEGQGPSLQLVIDMLGRASDFPALRKLQVIATGSRLEFAAGPGPERLEHLEVNVDSVKLPSTFAPRLRSLRLRGGMLPREARGLLKADWPVLEELDICTWRHVTSPRRWSLQPAHLRPILSGRRVPRLRLLSAFVPGDAFAWALVLSPVLRRLKEVHFTRLSDRGIETLECFADRLQHLERVRIPLPSTLAELRRLQAVFGDRFLIGNSDKTVSDEIRIWLARMKPERLRPRPRRPAGASPV